MKTRPFWAGEVNDNGNNALIVNLDNGNVSNDNVDNSNITDAVCLR